MDTFIRAFIAIDLSAEMHDKLDKLSADLRLQLQKVPIRWVRSQNIHLSLKFLGDISITNIDLLKEVLIRESKEHHSFEMSIGNLGAFPNKRRPRVIWIGIKAPQELNVIQHSIDIQAEKLGYTREDRPFSPHLTLGRVSRHVSVQDQHLISELLSSYQVGLIGTTLVDAVHLYKSDLKPGGAEYTRIFSASLPTPYSDQK